jgi:hypothetical protein
VNDRTADGTAFTSSGADNDGATSGNVILAPSEPSKTITVPVEGDKRKANEMFFANLLETGNALLLDAQGIGRILDDNPPGGKH